MRRSKWSAGKERPGWNEWNFLDTIREPEHMSKIDWKSESISSDGFVPDSDAGGKAGLLVCAFGSAASSRQEWIYGF
jgi:hypothetical protein